MKGTFRPLLAGAAACLLAAGCDYWKNLLDPKAVDKAAFLSVSVRDLWTKAPLEATCRAPGTGFLERTNADGAIVVPGPATGRYVMACADKDSLYHVGEAAFDLGPGGSRQVTVELPRYGGPSWYREDGRRAAVWLDAHKGRIPETVRLGALPVDSADSMFLYDWYVRREGAASETFIAQTRAPNFPFYVSDTGAKIFSVKISATPLGFKTYVVDSLAAELVAFTFNPKPVVKVSTDSTIRHNARCGESPLAISYTATDDVDCDSVVFTAPFPQSSLGENFHVRVDCSMDTAVRIFRLSDANPFGPPNTRREHLVATAYDNDDDTTQVTMEFRTVANQRPSIIRFQERDKGIRYLGFKNANVVLDLDLHDEDSFIDSVRVDWNDNTGVRGLAIPDSVSRTSPFKYTIHHLYDTLGIFKPIITVVDRCGALSEPKQFAAIEVKLNSQPTLSVTPKFLTPTLLRLVISSYDKDMEPGPESLNLTVDWNHPSITDSIIGYPCCEPARDTLYHQYPAPMDSAVIRVEVTDDHDGEISQTLTVKR